MPFLRLSSKQGPFIINHLLLLPLQKYMMELTAHQSSVGNVLQAGNQLISQGSLTEEEENEIREQMALLNSRWENLRVDSMDRQARYRVTLHTVVKTIKSVCSTVPQCQACVFLPDTKYIFYIVFCLFINIKILSLFVLHHEFLHSTTILDLFLKLLFCQ